MELEPTKSTSLENKENVGNSKQLKKRHVSVHFCSCTAFFSDAILKTT